MGDTNGARALNHAASERLSSLRLKEQSMKNRPVVENPIKEKKKVRQEALEKRPRTMLRKGGAIRGAES